jgi:MFS superfamily sulfate permease-like transporter
MIGNTSPLSPRRATWPRDLLASLVVFLVALPLCMGIAIASGADVAAGLVTGIVGGIVVGLLGGAPLQVSGPAAGLTVVCWEIIHELGLPAFGVAVFLCGVIQLAAGLLRLGQWFRAVSPAVIHGMLSGIGILILASQLHVMVDDRPRGSGLANLLSLPEAFVKGLSWPQWESAPLRRQRIAWLKQFGQYHERQAEIAGHTARHILHHASPEAQAAESRYLDPFVGPQEALQRDVEAARAEVAASLLAEANGTRAERLAAALQQAEQALADAVQALRDHDAPRVEASQRQATAALAEVLASLKSHDWAAKVGLATIALICLWQGLAPRRVRLIPAPLVAVVAVTLASWLADLPVLYVEVPDNLLEGLTFPSLNVFRDVALSQLLLAGVMLAAIASAETLLCASAVDRMHSGPRTNYDRELAAQGVGNTLCGLLGALPMTGVIVRSAANVQAGAQTRLSAILHGVWLLGFVVFLSNLLRLIPTAALAGILVYTGLRLIDFRGLVRLWREDRSEAAIFLVTIGLIVVEDLLVGVVTGLVLSAVKLLVRFSHLEARVEGGGQEPYRIELVGAATFLRLPVLASRLESIPHGTKVHVDLKQLTYLDHACLELLMSWTKQHTATGGEVVIDWNHLHSFLYHRGGTPPSPPPVPPPPAVGSSVEEPAAR